MLFCSIQGPLSHVPTSAGKDQRNLHHGLRCLACILRTTNGGNHSTLIHENRMTEMSSSSTLSHSSTPSADQNSAAPADGESVPFSELFEAFRKTVRCEH